MSRISQPCHLSSRCIRARKRSAGRRSCSMMTELTWSASKRMPPSSLYPWPHHLSPSTPSAITALLCRRIGSLGHSWNSATPTRNSKRRVLPRQRMEKSRRLNSIPMAFFWRLATRAALSIFGTSNPVNWSSSWNRTRMTPSNPSASPTAATTSPALLQRPIVLSFSTLGSSLLRRKSLGGPTKPTSW